MASSTAKVTFRIAMVVLVFLVLFYVGRPLYWKISATIHDIRQNKQTVKQGISQIVMEAQRTVGWYHDESDSGVHDHESRVGKKAGSATNRKLMMLHQVFL
ncbi:Low-density receptor-like protein [Trema orientale]|uniref:Low-density receptor-like protein n=1 Tax=Trema orientale TaxID=63057 RepID=A0A2P5FX71_TREOI|nr:Low-density receptor-like protein [Trema orientale]